MDDQALEVLKAAKATEEILAGRAESLAAVRTEYERKQKEVPPRPSTCPCSVHAIACAHLSPCDTHQGKWALVMPGLLQRLNVTIM